MDQLIGHPDDAQSPICDATDATFVDEVIEASKTVPVIVDFWAPWCGPCRQLTPALENVVKAAGGKVRLVKINTDENPVVSQQLRIQSIPTVYGFAGGRPVDGFAGALPESQIRAFVDKLIAASGGKAGPSPVEEALEQARAALEADDSGTAAAIFQQILQHDPEEARASAGLARCHLEAGRLDQAKAAIAAVPAGKASDPAVAAVRAAIELAADGSAATADSASLESTLAKDPDDHQARYDLALAHYRAGNAEAAIEALIEIVRRDREWNDQAARKQVLKILEALGPTNPLTTESRRKLSSILFS